MSATKNWHAFDLDGSICRLVLSAQLQASRSMTDVTMSEFANRRLFGEEIYWMKAEAENVTIMARLKSGNWTNWRVKMEGGKRRE